jgi:hypothetical protein
MSNEMECPICLCRMTVPSGYARRTIACRVGHVIALERGRRRRPAPGRARRPRRWPWAVLGSAVLIALLILAAGWPLHLGLLRRLAG